MTKYQAKYWKNYENKCGENMLKIDVKIESNQFKFQKWYFAR